MQVSNSAQDCAVYADEINDNPFLYLINTLDPGQRHISAVASKPGEGRSSTGFQKYKFVQSASADVPDSAV